MSEPQNENDQSEYSPPGPGEKHKLIEPFAGNFTAEVKIFMGPGDPMVSTGKMTNEWEHNGMFLRQIYVGDPNEGPFPSFEGSGYWGFNSSKGVYEGFWVDNSSDSMQFEEGNVDESGKSWEMSSSGTHPQTGKPYSKRSVIKLIDNDNHSVEAFMTHEGMDEMKVMELLYKRV